MPRDSFEIDLSGIGEGFVNGGGSGRVRIHWEDYEDEGEDASSDVAFDEWAAAGFPQWEASSDTSEDTTDYFSWLDTPGEVAEVGDLGGGEPMDPSAGPVEPEPVSFPESRVVETQKHDRVASRHRDFQVKPELRGTRSPEPRIRTGESKEPPITHGPYPEQEPVADDAPYYRLEGQDFWGVIIYEDGSADVFLSDNDEPAAPSPSPSPTPPSPDVGGRIPTPDELGLPIPKRVSGNPDGSETWTLVDANGEEYEMIVFPSSGQ